MRLLAVTFPSASLPKRSRLRLYADAKVPEVGLDFEERTQTLDRSESPIVLADKAAAVVV